MAYPAHSTSATASPLLPANPHSPVQFDWTGVITPNLRRRIERDVGLLIALLDAIDGDTESDGCEDSVLDGTVAHCRGSMWDEDCEPDTDAESGEAGDPVSGWLSPFDIGAPA